MLTAGRQAADRRDVQPAPEASVGLGPDQVDEFDHDIPVLTRKERKTIREQDRAGWRSPALATLQRPVMCPLRRMGLLPLRGFLLLAIVLVVVKLVETGMS